MDMVEDDHLGGFVPGGDKNSYYPVLWDKIISDFDVKNAIDIGCAEGHASKYFENRGVKVLAIDGSRKALYNAVFKPIKIHDYTKGPYIPDKMYDMVWCCEFVEHVERRYIENFFVTFAAARKVLIITHAIPGQGGYHHVNEQGDDYWITRIQKIYGSFVLDRKKTLEYRKLAHGYFHTSGLVFVRKPSL